MTNMTNDSVIFGEERMMKYENYIIIIYNIYIIYNNELKQSFCREVCGRK